MSPGRPPFGPARATLARSLHGLFVGIVSVIVVFAALFAWNLWRRPGAAGMVAVSCLLLALIPAGVSFARAPFTITLHDEGLFLRGHGRRGWLRWADLESARIWRAPLGKQPHVVTLRDRHGALTTISEAEYSNVDDLIAWVRAQLPGRIEEDRPAAAAGR